MATLNKVLLIGNLTRDPELRVTPKGTQHCQFSLAVSRKFNDESGNAREEVAYVEIDAWQKSAELVAKYLSKGSLCMVEGRLRLDQWEDKETHAKRSKLKVTLENVQFLGAPKGTGTREQNAELGDGDEEIDSELAGAGGKIPF